MQRREKNGQARAPREIIEAFDREQAEARELQRRHSEAVRISQARNRYVMIERRRRPR